MSGGRSGYGTPVMMAGWMESWPAAGNGKKERTSYKGRFTVCLRNSSALYTPSIRERLAAQRRIFYFV